MSTPGPPGLARAIDEGQFVPINGLDQWVTVRGRAMDNPVLMILGGSGVGFSALAPVFEPWEQAFTLVQWDQPGAGATNAKARGACGALTYDRLTADGVAVAQWACRRLGVAKIGVLATSGGTVIALKMVKARPDLFYAYVGNGQIVDWAAQGASSYAMVLDRARARGDAKAIAELEGIGPPPWRDAASVEVKSTYANAPTLAEAAAMAAPAFSQVSTPPANARYIVRDLPAQDVRAAARVTFEALRPELEAFRARDLGLTFEVPMVILQGREDAHTTTAEVEAWAREIQAPHKSLVLIDDAGHLSLFMTDVLLTLLRRYVRPLAEA